MIIFYRELPELVAYYNLERGSFETKINEGLCARTRRASLFSLKTMV